MLSRINPAQVRAARGMLGWSMVQLARAANVSISTVKRMEEASLQPTSETDHDKVQSAFEGAGVRFFAGVSEGVGLRMESR